MKKIITTLIVIMTLIAIENNGQEISFTVDNSGTLKTVDLSDATQGDVGSITPTFGGMDFGPDDILYGLDYFTNELYSVDTSNASTTLIGSSTPPSTHEWRGMAYDAEDGIMYAVASYHNSSDGTSNLYTVDVSDGSITLVGSQPTARDFVCIAIDDEGQMYGIDLTGPESQLYKIDKTDGSVSYIAELYDFGGAGVGYGMDFYSKDQTMYVNAYHNVSTFNKLFTVDLSDGSLELVGSLTNTTYALAIVSPYSCDFSADPTVICNGTTANFTDESSGAQTWNWSFEGGTPLSSTDQNPSVSYPDGGFYDVELTITDPDGDEYTKLKSNYITVLEIPEQSEIPEGEENPCTNSLYYYSTEEVLYAQDYDWEIDPVEAGTLEANGNEASLQVASDWTGDFTIKVRATNQCGDGDWSDNLECTVHISPEEFSLQGGGAYCVGGEGVEITLDGSQSGIEYDLLLDGDYTGISVDGTGSEVSFGMITDEGFYTAVGSNDNCTTPMMDQVEVEAIDLPAPPGTPEGEAFVCPGDIEDYETSGSEEAVTYIWTINPAEAGGVDGDGLIVTVTWNTDFIGEATLYVAGMNDCGEGESSEEFMVTFEGATPVITGEDMVCDFSEEIYEVEEHTGSTYTWEVTGGIIINGDGTNTITIAWDGEGNGTISVEENTQADCLGISEIFEVIIDDCTGIFENGLADFSIYPNPAKNEITISLNDKQINNAVILIYNSMGQLMMNQESENLTEQKMDISFLQNGLFVIEIQQNNKSIVRKQFIKN